MTVKNELLNLSEYWRGRLLRISRKLLRRHTNIHTILIGRVSEVCEVCEVCGEAVSSCEFLNFRFFVFLDEERDRVTGELKDPSVHFPADMVIVSEKYTVYEPGMSYINIPPSLSECDDECVEMESVETHGRASDEVDDDECEVDALHYEYGRVTPKLRQNYLEYLNTHCQHFVCSDFPEIITLNMMEMKRDDIRFFRCYLTGKFDQGYLVYNREMKPIISLN